MMSYRKVAVTAGMYVWRAGSGGGRYRLPAGAAAADERRRCSAVNERISRAGKHKALDARPYWLLTGANGAGAERPAPDQPWTRPPP